MSLADQNCVPCKGGVPPMGQEQAEKLLRELDDGWTLNSKGHLERTYEFSNFVAAMAFANRVGEIAEAQNHHPDILLGWGRVRITIWTHTVDGLSESDFVLAAKLDRLA